MPNLAGRPIATKFTGSVASCFIKTGVHFHPSILSLSRFSAKKTKFLSKNLRCRIYEIYIFPVEKTNCYDLNILIRHIIPWVNGNAFCECTQASTRVERIAYMNLSIFAEFKCANGLDKVSSHLLHINRDLT